MKISKLFPIESYFPLFVCDPFPTLSTFGLLISSEKETAIGINGSLLP